MSDRLVQAVKQLLAHERMQPDMRDDYGWQIWDELENAIGELDSQSARGSINDPGDQVTNPPFAGSGFPA